MIRRLILFYIIALICGWADLWSKDRVFAELEYNYTAPAYEQNEAITVITGLLSFEGGINTGISWSLLQDSNNILRVVMIVAILIIGGLVHWMHPRHLILYVGLGFVLGGAAGNLLDRFHGEFGGVRDFIRVDLFSFPLFNLADTWITIGAVFIVLYLLFEHRLDPHLLPKKLEQHRSTESSTPPAASSTDLTSE